MHTQIPTAGSGVPANPQSAIPNPQSLELYPGFAYEAAKHQVRSGKIEAANAVPLPGPLRKAFAGEPRHLYGFTLRPVTAGLEAILTRIDSLILPTFATVLANQGKSAEDVNAAIAEKVKPNADGLIETVYCFIKHGKELRGLLDKGRVTFREAAMEELGEKLNPIQLALLYKAVCEHYAQAFITAVSYEAAQSGDDNTVFTRPPAEPVTASAGGLTSSAP
jgi:hypothetical protein